MRYKLFGNTGLRVSELCLGTMTFGTEWGWGADYKQSKSQFEAFVKAGGNFIDTANRYTEGTSEKWLGEFIAWDRDKFVISTKYTLYDRMHDVNFSGNHRKNMMRSVQGSLKRLNTDYIDIFWVHVWDNTTPIEEIMRGLDDLVSRGMVHYIGISDTPAWIVSRANMLAELRGWTSFAGIQIEYSLLQRTGERELLPMAKALNMATTAWSPLAGGVLTGKYLKGEQGRIIENSSKRSEKSNAITQEVVNIAEELGILPSQVALNWLRQRNQLVIPIVGGRTEQHLQDSLGCLSFTLSEAHIQRLDEISKPELGFPHEFLASNNVKDIMSGGTHTWLDK